jgi:hypothetical protein
MSEIQSEGLSTAAQNSTKQKEIARNPQTGEFQEPSNLENAKNGKEGSEWLGGPQNGNETPGKQTDGAYQTAAHSTGYTDQLGSDGYTKHPFNETTGEASKQAPDGSGSQAYTDKLGGSSDN